MSEPIAPDMLLEVAPIMLDEVSGGAMLRWPVSRAMARGNAEHHAWLRDTYNSAAESAFAKGAYRTFGDYMSRVGIHAKQAGEWARSAEASWWRRNFGTVE